MLVMADVWSDDQGGAWRSHSWVEVCASICGLVVAGFCDRGEALNFGSDAVRRLDTGRWSRRFGGTCFDGDGGQRCGWVMVQQVKGQGGRYGAHRWYGILGRSEWR